MIMKYIVCFIVGVAIATGLNIGLQHAFNMESNSLAAIVLGLFLGFTSVTAVFWIWDYATGNI